MLNAPNGLREALLAVIVGTFPVVPQGNQEKAFCTDVPSRRTFKGITVYEGDGIESLSRLYVLVREIAVQDCHYSDTGEASNVDFTKSVET